MHRLKDISVVLALLLVACLIAAYMTRDSGAAAVPAQKAELAPENAVDASFLDMARQMAALAETPDEQDQAREALNLSDHELDQAWVTALRAAAAYRPPATGPLHDLIIQSNALKTRIAVEQDRIAQLTKQAAADSQDQIELVKAQLALDQDELDDAQQDLARQGGDPHSVLERALQEHEATQHQAPQGFKNAAPPSPATLFEQVRAWFALDSRDTQLRSAAQQASSHGAVLASRHNDLEKQLSSSATDGDNTARIVSLRHQADQRKTLSELDQRIQDCQQLAGVYQRWSQLLETRRRGVLHMMLGSFAQILAILLLSLLADLAIRRAFHRPARQRLNQMRVMATVAVQLVAAVLIVLVLFGAPSQVSTIIGLATAGLTVVLKDFIVAFFGWFTLMGKNGIRVGDWVEINGVGGEVVDIGVLKTVLLELGNWNDLGHPTGRQVAFSNSFAIEGHYFNFSTSGQWLWDELVVTLPAGDDVYTTAQEIRRLVEQATDADSAQATQDWERVTTRYGSRSFSAKPAVDLRPSSSGLEVVVRYITRAPERYTMKTKLFQGIVELLHKPAPAGQLPA
ncbi:MAG TPA: mechanosensitive ion channel domain-containing protein [Bryobacteraceae bacterium]|jgi:small-conductance mechanosensitive channel